MKFEDFLKKQHSSQYSGTDDDMPDHFDNWLGDLDGQDIIDYAEYFGQLEFINGQQDGLKMAREIIKS